jgi:acetyl-CoA carboxylase carboxyl transferase subunit alpha
MSIVLDFEKQILELENRLADLRHSAAAGDFNILSEVAQVEKKLQASIKNIYAKLTPWQVVQVARHPERPHTSDYVHRLIRDFHPLSGDRNFGEDAAMISGLGYFRGVPVMVLGHEKGRDTETRLKHNFGMPKPEGYRKAARLFDLASRLKIPVLTFIDTAGAYAGLDAEERGQSEAIASCLEKGLGAEVPVVTTIIGEGGSGGAVAIATGNVILMLEHAIYSVISPEGCASILWRTKEKRQEAAAAQRFTAKYLKGFGMIDQIVPEPPGGAHRNRMATVDRVGDVLENALKKLLVQSGGMLKDNRRKKFLQMGRLVG